MKIKFIKNPAGKYSLSYEVGEEINLPDSMAMDLLADGYAVLVQEKPQNASSKVISEKR